MKTLVASAPGKVVLSGEYAVLDGAPAICMAINRRATVQLTDIEGDLNRVRAPGYSDVDGEFRTTPGGLEWVRGKRHYSLIDSVWAAANITSSNSRHIVIDTQEFLDTATGNKTGIGSSAAATAALAIALLPNDDISTVARRAHADFQAGAGSGVDVACSVSGGLIDYRMQGFSARALDWPDELLFQVLWTGVAASTTAKLAKLNIGLAESRPVHPSRARLAAAAEKMAQAWRTRACTSILSEYPKYVDVLRSFSADHELGIFDAGHGDLVDAARAENLVYKPCGAGGGDVGIVFGMNAAQLQSFSETQAARCSPVDCEIDYRGATIEKLLPEGMLSRDMGYVNSE